MLLTRFVNALVGKNTDASSGDAVSGAQAGEAEAFNQEFVVDQAVIDAFKTGDIKAAQEFYQAGLDVNADEGVLLATAATAGHADLLQVACEEMGGVLSDGKCDNMAFITAVSSDVKTYINNRLDFEANNNIEYTPKPVRTTQKTKSRTP